MLTGTDFEPRRVPFLVPRRALFSPPPRRAPFPQRRDVRLFSRAEAHAFLQHRSARLFLCTEAHAIFLSRSRVSQTASDRLSIISTEKPAFKKLWAPALCLEPPDWTYHTTDEKQVTHNLWGNLNCCERPTFNCHLQVGEPITMLSLYFRERVTKIPKDSFAKAKLSKKNISRRPRNRRK